MSLPFLRIGTPVYSTASEVMSIPMVGKRLRGDSQQLIVDGFSQSKTFNISRGSFVGSYTFSVTDLETSTSSVNLTNTTFVAPTVQLAISGTAVSGNSIILSTELGTLINLPFTTTQSSSQVADLLAATISSNEFSGSSNGSNLTISGPWGSYYNGLNISISGFTSSTLTASLSGTEFTGGVTQYNLDITVPGYRFDAGSQTFNFTVGTYAVS